MISFKMCSLRLPDPKFMAIILKRELFMRQRFFLLLLTSVFLLTGSVYAQEISVNGKVLDESNEPFIGATVRLKSNPAKGTVTGLDGTFTIRAKRGEILIISYIGCCTEEVKAAPTVVVHLRHDDALLDEVVVTGYQTVSRRESAAAISTVKMSEIITPEAMSVDQMLQGKIPGVSVMSTSGEPSAIPTIRIRGNSTINGNKAPVWVVDGVIMSDIVPFTASDLNSPDAAYLIGNNISGISPQDIESISVLKDASATAIYGVKAANGVIVITTKKGKASAPVVSYDLNMGVSTAPTYDRFDRMNSQERVQLSKDIYDARLQYPRVPTGESYEGALQKLLGKQITQEEFATLVGRYETMNTDWFDALFSEALTQNHSVSVSGGSDRVRYYSSLSYSDSPGIAKESYSHRFTGLGRLSVAINKIFDVDLKLEISNQSNRGFSTLNPFRYAFDTARSIPLYNEDGSRYFYSRSNAFNDVTYNVLNELENTGMKSNSRRMGGVLNLKARILPGLTYNGTISHYWNQNRNYRWATDHSYEVGAIRGYDYGAWQRGEERYEKSALPLGGTYSEANTSNRSYTLRNTLNYIQAFEDVHEVNLFAGIEARSDKYDGLSQLFYGWDPTYGQTVSPVYTKEYIRRLENGFFTPSITRKVTQVASYFGSASYTYDNRYVINANIRSDGANKFGSNPKYRWLPTWSVAGKWIVSNEQFMENVNFIDHLSFRGSYGLQGNIHDDATPFLIARMGAIDNISDQRLGRIERLPNPDLRWEKTKSYNIGVDFAMLEQRLTFTLDYYRKNTSDLITDMAVSPSTGRSYMFMNAGDAVNQGFEGVVRWDVLRGKLFDWNVSFNVSHNTNEIKHAYDAKLTDTEKYQKMLEGNVATVGQPLGTIYSFRYAGLSKENGFPLFYAKDGRKVHQGDYEAMELVPSGSIYPDFSGGFDTRLTYKKNLSLSVGFSYQVGGVRRLPSVYNGVRQAFDPTANVSREFNNRWRKPGDEATAAMPALYDTRIANNFPEELMALHDAGRDSDVYMVDMFDKSDARIAKSDFLRLRNVTLSYRLPAAWISTLKIEGCSLRLQGSNLFVWKSSKWNGLDPESAYANMPIMPSYNFSVNLIF